ncbi:Protein-tyrosine phosphatase-like PTPLA [Neofusicoccum parvum]|uniref:Very-long-chain (3R)-3-hydroxyacyl-CoA dehydratase n=2 Tax=Neofusicoccum parvum TaxID=310453 RepID=R1GAF9_BOTPV|nr:putative protein tyrosine phosphatase protein [Neofusicoccum parvum UCRNP2]GME26744.1 Protein-tyrosine phosphatase-like PTPLA [Neofusicoccum parvum]GME44012.1 Protein-tyrosine phosphatase-like PTPLA [Neofusicoccum parvum]
MSTPPSKPKGSSVAQTYLLCYNAASALLWTSVLGRVVLLVPLVGVSNVFGGVDDFVRWVQTLALAEVASRLLLVWGIAYPFPHSTSHSPAFAGMLLAWSVTEVIRYSYFVFLLSSGRIPSFLSWLRYNTFYVLYPLGISCECWLVYKAIGPAGEVNPLIAYGLWAVLAIYVPGSYILYSHMMAQRRRVMRGKKRAD